MLNVFPHSSLTRYVTEWLGGMVAANIVQTNEDNSAYSIPSEYRDFLLRGGVAFSSALPTFATKHQDVVQAFRSDGPKGEFMHCHVVYTI